MEREGEVTDSPTGDVEYDPEALEEARERMHATGHGGESDDPEGEHEAGALDDAAKKIHADE